jgi:predicted aspartyl protease
MIRCLPPASFLQLALFGLLTLPGAASAERFGHAAPLERKPSGNYYLDVSLAPGMSEEFLVDTGSGYVVLTKATFDAVRDLPGTRHLRDITGRMANGKSARARIYHLARLELAGNCVLEDVEVAVIPGSTRNILGLSALRRVAPFAMELSPPKLLYSACATSSLAAAEVPVTAASADAQASRK